MHGSGLCWFDGRVYAVKGGCRESWCYDPSVAQRDEVGRAPCLPRGAMGPCSGAGNPGELLVFDILGRRVPAAPGSSGIRLDGAVRPGVYFVVLPGARRAVKLVVHE